jgi:hypothetical protein
MAVAKALIGWPLTRDELTAGVEASTYVLRCEAGTNGAEDLVFGGAGLTANRELWMSGDGQEDGVGAGDIGGVGDLLELLKECIETYAGDTVEVTVTLTSAHLIYIHQTAGDALKIYWSHANTTLDPAVWGMVSETKTVDGFDRIVGDKIPEGIWKPSKALAEDSRSRKRYYGGAAVAPSGAYRASVLSSTLLERQIAFRYLSQELALDEYAAAGAPTNTWQSLWDRALVQGSPVRLYLDESAMTSSDYSLWRLDPEQYADPLVRDPNTRIRWAVTCSLVEAA